MAQVVAFLGIHTTEELRLVERAAIIAFQRHLEAKGFRPSSISRKITTLSSLFSHLVCHRLSIWNPCRELRRPRRNRRQGSTPAFSRQDARKLLDAPDPTTLLGLRDRAILSLGLQNGPRRASIVALRVRDFYQDRGRRSRAADSSPDRPAHPGVSGSRGARRRPRWTAVSALCPCKGCPQLRFLSPWTVNRMVKDHARRLAIAGRHTAHSMRATFITSSGSRGASGRGPACRRPRQCRHDPPLRPACLRSSPKRHDACQLLT
jgi:integrase